MLTLKGMAESSGLSEDEVLVLNAGICMLSTVVLGGEPPSACSGLAVWDEYTPDGALVFGRNWDIEGKSLQPYMKCLLVVVFNPDSGNAFIVQIADAKECVSVERATFTARVRKTEQQGVLAAYNSFVPPYPDGWTGKVADPLPEEMDPRYSNLIKLANYYGFRGKLDVQGMKELLDIEVRDGGATHREALWTVAA
ncbi:MAG: hypothetical protein VB144_08045 [Clostridia bacterium]|nr:hypothetical protein [Clostridia bacterium]